MPHLAAHQRVAVPHGAVVFSHDAHQVPLFPVALARFGALLEVPMYTPCRKIRPGAKAFMAARSCPPRWDTSDHAPAAAIYFRGRRQGVFHAQSA